MKKAGTDWFETEAIRTYAPSITHHSNFQRCGSGRRNQFHASNIPCAAKAVKGPDDNEKKVAAPTAEVLTQR